MRASDFLRYVLLPLRPAGLLLLVSVTVGLGIAVHSGIFGILIAVILLSWLFSYAYVLLQHMAHGGHEPPVLSYEMLDPVHQARLMFHAAVVVAAAMGLAALSHDASAWFAAVLGVIGLAALPASIAALAVSESVVSSVNPLVLWRLARAQGLSYLAVVVVALLYGTVIAVLGTRAGLPMSLLTAFVMPASQPLWQLMAVILVIEFAWLSLFALIGGSVYQERLAVGHEPIDAPERHAQRAAVELEKERARFYDHVYMQARSRNLAGAWRSIERELQAQQHGAEFCDWLLARLIQLDDPRLAGRLAQVEISRLLSHDNARVTRLAQVVLAADASFRPRTAAETLRVADLARLSGDRATAARLVANFDEHFPGDAAIAEAQALAEAVRRDPVRPTPPPSVG